MPFQKCKNIKTEPKELIGIVKEKMDIDESRWCCPICKQWDKAKNMVPAIIKGVPSVDNETGKIHKNSTWFGRAHLKCIQRYNETHEPKYSIREYDKGKFLGEATPI